jgi:chromosome segregation ATPase
VVAKPLATVEVDAHWQRYDKFGTPGARKHMERQTLLATLSAELREVSAKLAQSDVVLKRLQQELAMFDDILQHAQQSATRANDEYQRVFTEYRKLLDGSAGLPPSRALMEKLNELRAEQARAHDEQAAAKDRVKKYQGQVRVAQLELATEESNRNALRKALDDLAWQIKKLSDAGPQGG